MIQENLKAQRLKKGLSQEELAAQIHVVRQTVSKWEKGLSVPDAQTLIQIAQVLETPVSALLGEKIPEEKEEEKLQIMAEKLERINACLAERTSRIRRVTRVVAIVAILLAAAGIVLLLLTTGLLHRPPYGPNVIGGPDEATGIFVTGTNWLAFGVKMAACVGAMVAGGILLYRTRR